VKVRVKATPAPVPLVAFSVTGMVPAAVGVPEKSPAGVQRQAGRHCRLPPFAKHAKERGTHFVGNARKIKSPGHPVECL
jgi:hypothetical protein